MRSVLRIGVLALGLVSASQAVSQSISNAYRMLVVYTDSTEALYPGINMYRDQVQGIIDGMNQAYEDSELETRVELAGLIWDKTYDRPDSPFSYGCNFRADLHYGTNGLGRYKAMRHAYSADVILLLHQSNASSSGAGCAEGFSTAAAVGFGSTWVNGESGVFTWAHEVGHIHNAGHCNGYRLTLDSIGNPIMGPFAYRSGQWMDSVVISDTRKPYSGFNTTMAYTLGNSPECDASSGPYYINTAHTISDNYLFKQDGQHPERPQWDSVADPISWAGVFANPDVFWQDSVTMALYPTGNSRFPVRRRIQYVGSPSPVVNDTLSYRMVNYVYFDTAHGKSVRDFVSIPSSVTLASANSLGQSLGDTQWVYSHIAALDSVKIQSGFKVKEGSYLKISVGQPVSGLSKSGRSRMNARQEGLSSGDESASSPSRAFGARVRYDAASRAVRLQVNSEVEAVLRAEVYDLRGVRIVALAPSRMKAGENLRIIPVGDLKNGVYLVRMTMGEQSQVLRFVKR